MKFSDWKLWYKNLPWTGKWFLWLIFIRPVIDNFYYLKETSILLSPLYIVGVLTPFVVLISIMKMPRKSYSPVDYVFRFFAIASLISSLILLIKNDFSIESIGFFFKINLPLYIYYFARYLVRSKADLHGVLQMFLYSSVFVVALFAYEIFIQKIGLEYSRGLERIRGGYGDIMNYAVYVQLGFLITCYFFFENAGKSKSRMSIFIVLLTAALCLFVLMNISHASSYMIFFVLVLLFIVFNLKRHRFAGLVLITFVVFMLYFYGSSMFEKHINPLVESEIYVYQGEQEQEYLFHGRFGRWQRQTGFFFDQPVYAMFLGIPLSVKEAFAFIGSGPHNDFIRIMQFSGFIGLVAYLLFIFILIIRSFKLQLPQRFVALGTLAIFLLYSISTVPTLYCSLVYVGFCVYSFVSLPASLDRQS